MWTGILQRLDLAVLAPEEDDVIAQHAEDGRLVLGDVLCWQGWVPVLTVAQSRDLAAQIVWVGGLLKRRRIVYGLRTPSVLLVTTGVAGDDVANQTLQTHQLPPKY